MSRTRAWLKYFLCRASLTPQAVWSAWHVLRWEFGHGASARSGKPVDSEGRDVPWFTYPALEYLRQLDLSDKSVFEFGAGGSTLFWARCARRVVSVEHNPSWYENVRVGAAKAGNCHVSLAAEPAAYVGALAKSPEMFDIIVVDGIERRACCAAALTKLKPGGMIILDNSDWHHVCAASLRAGDLIEVDFSGFGPINGYTWTTSIFLHREFRFAPRGLKQPAHGVGSLPHEEQST